MEKGGVYRLNKEEDTHGRENDRVIAGKRTFVSAVVLVVDSWVEAMIVNSSPSELRRVTGTRVNYVHILLLVSLLEPYMDIAFSFQRSKNPNSCRADVEEKISRVDQIHWRDLH